MSLILDFTFFLDKKSNKKIFIGWLYFHDIVLLNNVFSFALMQKKQKIKPENQKRKNYLKVPFRSPSRSSFVLDSRTTATLLYGCFLCFLFKGGFANGGYWERAGFIKIFFSFVLITHELIIYLSSWIDNFKRNKRSSLKIKSAKTTSKRRSAARAVRPEGSTRGLLPLCFIVVFYAFYLRAVKRSGERRRFVYVKMFFSFLLDQKRNKKITAWKLIT